MEKVSRVLDHPPPTNGGVGKCGQNAGGCNFERSSEAGKGD